MCSGGSVCAVCSVWALCAGAVGGGEATIVQQGRKRTVCCMVAVGAVSGLCGVLLLGAGYSSRSGDGGVVGCATHALA